MKKTDPVRRVTQHVNSSRPPLITEALVTLMHDHTCLQMRPWCDHTRQDSLINSHSSQSYENYFLSTLWGVFLPARNSIFFILLEKELRREAKFFDAFFKTQELSDHSYCFFFCAEDKSRTNDCKRQKSTINVKSTNNKKRHA